MTDEQIKELNELAEPLKKWIQKNFHPYVTVIIAETGVKVTEDTYFNPLN